MKETDYSVITEEIKDQLDMHDWPLLDYVETQLATQIVLGIYLTNDMMKGFGQDIQGVISIISSQKRISTIAAGVSSFYQNDSPICTYEDLSGDIWMILLCLNASIDRMRNNG